VERGPPTDHHHTPIGIDSTLENGSGEKQNNAAACPDSRRRSTGYCAKQFRRQLTGTQDAGGGKESNTI